MISEGLEGERPAGKHRSLGCPMAQGFLFALPMATTALYDWLDDDRLKQAVAQGTRLA